MADLVEEFYEEIKNTYPDISLNEFRIICNSPFKFIKEIINRGVLKNVRLQYFGVFEVMPSRVKYSLKTFMPPLMKIRSTHSATLHISL